MDVAKRLVTHCEQPPPGSSARGGRNIGSSLIALLAAGCGNGVTRGGDTTHDIAADTLTVSSGALAGTYTR